ncbi:UNVERIFIED_CONTAM: hypothetical protein K2H54_029722 [Gekko kuhli]
MADFPAKVSTRTSTPAGAHAGAGRSGSLDLDFLRSPFGVLMIVEILRCRLNGVWIALAVAIMGGGGGGVKRGLPQAPFGPRPHLERLDTDSEGLQIL